MENWQEKTLGVICKESGGSIQTGPFGSQLHESDYVEEGVAVIMPKDIVNDKLDLRKAAKVTPRMADKLKRHKLKKNDIIFPRRGDLNKRALIDENTEGALCGTGCLKIDLPEIQLSTKFLFNYLKLPSVVEWIIGQSIGATMENLNTGTLSKIPIQFPDLPTQQRIAGILSAYDELIEVNNQRIRLLEDTARQLYKEWFVRLRFPGYEQTKFVKGLPEGWEYREILSLGKIITGKTPSTQIADYHGGEFPFIKTPDMHGNVFILTTEETLTQKGVKSQKGLTLPDNSIIVNCIGSLAGLVSITTQQSQTNQQIHSIVLSDLVNREFAYFAITDLREVIYLYGNTGSTMTNLSKGKFERLLFLYPSRELVEEYHATAHPIFEQIKVLNRQNTQLRQIRDRLLPRLISGKLSV